MDTGKAASLMAHRRDSLQRADMKEEVDMGTLELVGHDGASSEAGTCREDNRMEEDSSHAYFEVLS